MHYYSRLPLVCSSLGEFNSKLTLNFTLIFNFSFSFLIGFKSLLSSMFSKQKMLVSITYISSLVSTLYFSMVMQSTALTVLFAVVQIISLAFMLFGIAPKGTSSSFKMFGTLFKHQASATLPIWDFNLILQLIIMIIKIPTMLMHNLVKGVKIKFI